ncbi:MAG: hypothetical protein D8B54_09675 [Catonella sp.]|nr:MAG: hypothetical protein D8B54_09675 [Catonella sp.]
MKADCDYLTKWAILEILILRTCTIMTWAFLWSTDRKCGSRFKPISFFVKVGYLGYNGVCFGGAIYE